ncbi:response regulator transcription factor [uncultured Acetatifactor sp.]|uniref:response regulator transcription factor n=1 Tax=uncultured Acetatifactor sp. TaxID=1671927 RepID=UPI00260D88A7|nr:response regulator transcription factor [uncultured Acetatifactor sp.]
MTDILVVEDDEAISNLISMNLSAEGYRCVCAYDGMQGADYIEQRAFDLVLLDIMLPEVDGYELLEYIKPTGTPVIFLTAKGSINDKVRGLKAGADDYLVKPFQVGELLARVEAVLRRLGKGDRQLEFGDVSVQLSSRQVLKAGQPVVLTMKEFDLLVELMQNRNIALYREQLYEKVWKEPFTGATRTLDSHIQRLRKKLGWEDKIRTVFRIGYRLEGNG